MRVTVLIVAAAQIAGFVYLALTRTTGSDAAGNAMAQGFVTLAGIVIAICLVPALILAVNRKALPLALGLAMAPPLLALVSPL